MALPFKVEDDTVYHVRTEPSPYVLELERRVEELTGVVEELRGVVQTMHTVLVENGLIPFNQDQDQPNPSEGRVEDAPESNGTADKRGEDETPPEDGREAIDLKHEVLVIEYDQESVEDFPNPGKRVKEKDIPETGDKAEKVGKEGSNAINDEDDESNTTESGSQPTYWNQTPKPRQKRTSYKDLVVGKRSSGSPSPPPKKRAKLSTSKKGRENRQSSSATSKESRTHQCITCGEIFPNLPRLSLHCTKFQPRHGKFCRRMNKYFNSAKSWATHLRSCSYQHHQDQVDKENECDDDSQSEQLQCVTCNQLFNNGMALSRHCSSFEPRHGKWCRRMNRVYNRKADWLKHNDECGCQFRTEYVLNVEEEDSPEPAELQQLTQRLSERYGAADVID